MCCIWITNNILVLLSLSATVSGAKPCEWLVWMFWSCGRSGDTRPGDNPPLPHPYCSHRHPCHSSQPWPCTGWDSRDQFSFFFHYSSVTVFSSYLYIPFYGYILLSYLTQGMLHVYTDSAFCIWWDSPKLWCVCTANPKMQSATQTLLSEPSFQISSIRRLLEDPDAPQPSPPPSHNFSAARPASSPPNNAPKFSLRNCELLLFCVCREVLRRLSVEEVNHSLMQAILNLHMSYYNIVWYWLE